MRAALLLLLPALAAAAETPPATADPARYAAMMEQSPFALATVLEEPKAPTESFAANWELTGLAKLRNDKGVEKDFVTIRSRDKRVSFSLTGDEESKDEDALGVSIQSVDWQEGSRKSTVTLKKGTEIAKVEFGQETTPPAPPAAMGQQPNVNQMRGGQPMPGVNPNFNPGIRPPNAGLNPGVPNNGLNRPPGVIQRPQVPNSGAVLPSSPVAVYPQAPMVNGAAPNNGSPRRVRVINSR